MITSIFCEQVHLGAFLFFDRDAAERSNLSTVIQTLACQLGEADPQIGLAISDAIKEFSGIIRSPLHFQFLKLLIEPLSSIEPKSTLLVVLDALDECGSPQEQEQLLEILAEGSCMLPLTVRVLAISHAAPDITNAFGFHTHIVSHQLDIGSSSNHNNIFTFFQHSTAKIHCTRKHIFPELDWPGNDIIHQLTACASSLIIWASTTL